MENNISQEVVKHSEERDAALTKLLTLDLDQNARPNESDCWITPNDTDIRLKDYLESEIVLQNTKTKAARPGFDTQAQTDESMFQHAHDFLTKGKYGKDSLEKVLTKLYKSVHDKEYTFGQSQKGKKGGVEERREWSYYLHTRSMILDLADRHIGEGTRDKMTKSI